MRKQVSAIFFILIVFSSPTSSGLVSVWGEPQDSSYVINLNVTFSNNGTENWLFDEEETTISLFMNTTWQMVRLTNLSRIIERVETDADGNALAILQFPTELKPGRTLNYAVTYEVVSKPRLLPDMDEEAAGTLGDIPGNLKREHCRAEKNWIVSDKDLQDLASNVTRGETSVLTMVKNMVAWISKNVRYSTRDLPRYANETFEEKQGDCDDQAILLITLCRIMEIPAYLQVGSIYLPEQDYLEETYWKGHVHVISKRIGWHGWAVIYVPPWGWLPVDLTYVIASGGLDDPLNAIRGAAVTMQRVVQYMNVSKTDYVASSRRYKESLLESSFFISEQDEMISVSSIGRQDDIMRRLLPLVLIGLVIPVAVAAIVEIIYVTKKKREFRVQTETN